MLAACNFNNPQRVQRLLADGVEPDVADERRGDSALIIAAKNCHWEVGIDHNYVCFLFLTTTFSIQTIKEIHKVKLYIILEMEIILYDVVLPKLFGVQIC